MTALEKIAFWEHEETNPPDVFISTLETALMRTWGEIPREAAVRRLRALMLMTLQAGRMTNQEPPPLPPPFTEKGEGHGFFKADFYENRTDLWIASTVLRTPLLLIAEKGKKGFFFESIRTRDGAPSTRVFADAPPGETGLGPFAVVAAAVAASAAVVGVAHYAINLIDRELARQHDAKEMVNAQATAIALIAEHSKAEQAAGKSLAWDAQKLAQFQLLLERQKVVGARKGVGLPEPFVGAITSVGKAGGEILQGAGEGAATVIEEAGTQAKAVGESLFPLLVIGGLAAAAFLFKSPATPPPPVYVQSTPPPLPPKRAPIPDAEFE